MATVLVKNELGGMVKHFRLPADVKTAQTFCDKALEGRYWIYKKTGESGDLSGVNEAILVRVLIRDRETGKHWYLNFYAKPTVDKQDVINALSGWTGADDIIILDFRRIKFASGGAGAGSSSGSSSP